MKSMLVLVNNEFNNDPRVNRSVTASCAYFDRITVLSGVPNMKDRINSQEGNVAIIRYYYYKPNFSRSNSVKKALAVAMGNKDKGLRQNVNGNNSSNPFRNLLFIGWFFYIILMNIWLFIRFAGKKADIYYANDFDTLLVAFLLSRVHRGQLIYDSHELYSDLLGDSPKIYKALVQWIEGALANKASSIITVNNPIARILQERYRLPVTPNVVYNTPYFQKVELNSTLPRTPFKLLYHGMYLPGRNLEELVRSMKEVDNFHLYFRGFGVLENQLRDMVSELSLQDKVSFLEPVKMKDLVASAKGFDMGIVPYKGSENELNSYYSTPNKIFEYMMAGLALAASDLPVLREIVTSEKIGVVFDTANPAEMATVLNQVTQEDLVRMKQNSLLAAERVYNFNQESKKLVRIYEDLYLHAA